MKELTLEMIKAASEVVEKRGGLQNHGDMFCVKGQWYFINKDGKAEPCEVILDEVKDEE